MSPLMRRTLLHSASALLGIGAAAWPAVTLASPGRQEAPVPSVLPGADPEPRTESPSAGELTTPGVADPSVLARPFLSQYSKVWTPQEAKVARLFQITNPASGTKGFTIDFNKKVTAAAFDPRTFVTLLDASGKPRSRQTTVGEELRTAMDTYEVPEIVLEESAEVGVDGQFFYYFTVGRVATGLEDDVFLYYSWFIRPASAPTSLVCRYRFSDKNMALDDTRAKDFLGSVGSGLSDGIYYFRKLPDNSILVKPAENTNERLRLKSQFSVEFTAIDAVL